MNNAREFHWPSILQFVLSLIAAVALFLAGGLLLVVGVTELVGSGFNSPEATESFLLGTSFLLAGGLMLPSAWYALRRLGSPSAPPSPRRRARLLILILLLTLLVPPALFVGNLVSQNDTIAWFLLPGINLLVISLPIAWLVWLGKRGLPGGSDQRQWGIFASGLTLGPTLTLGVELLAILGLGSLLILAMTLDQNLFRQFSTLLIRLGNAPPDMDAWLRILTPLLSQPITLIGIFTFGSVLTPLIEEALKPIGLWLLAGRRLTPAEGFVGGLLSGAAFALFENLGNTSAGGETWAMLAAARITTALLHMLTTGLVGWALAHAWSRGRYFRLAVAYTTSVTLHGLWNGLGIAGFLLPQLTLPEGMTISPDTTLNLIVVALSVFTALNLFFYLAINRGLRKSTPPTSVLPPALPAEPAAGEHPNPDQE